MATQWAFKRKISIISILIACSIIIITTLIFLILQTDPSCRDGIQNQNEKGVDCGEVCSVVCPFEVLEPTLLWSRIFKEGDGYDIIAYIRNPNTHLVASELTYTITIFNTKQQLLHTIQGTTSLLPRSTTPIFHNDINLGKEIAPRMVIDINGIRWQYQTALEDIDIEARQISFSVTDDGYPQVQSTITNVGYTDARDVKLYASVYDDVGNVIIAAQSELATLPQGQSEIVFFNWRTPFNEYISVCNKDTDIFLLLSIPTFLEEKSTLRNNKIVLEEYSEYKASNDTIQLFTHTHATNSWVDGATTKSHEQLLERITISLQDTTRSTSIVVMAIPSVAQSLLTQLQSTIISPADGSVTYIPPVIADTFLELDVLSTIDIPDGVLVLEQPQSSSHLYINSTPRVCNVRYGRTDIFVLPRI